MPGLRAAQNLQCPTPGTDKVGNCPAVAGGGRVLGTTGIDWCVSRAKQRQGNVQKCALHVQICFLLIRSIDFVVVLIAVVVKHYTISSVFVNKYPVHESVTFSPG